MRVAIYNRHWSTTGGGERYAGAIAEVLAARHEVTLLGHEPVDLGRLSERLELDLSAASLRSIGPGPEAVTRASAGADLFVNASYASDDRSAAARSLYVVFFPTLPGGGRRPGTAGRAALRRAGAALARSGGGARGDGRGAVVLDGFHRPERVRGVPVRWTDGSGLVEVPGGRRLTVALARLQPRSVGDVPVEVRVDGNVAARSIVRPRGRSGSPVRLVAVAELPPGRHVLELVSPAWRPAEHGGTDPRTLGVAVLGVFAGSVPARLAQAVAQTAAVATAEPTAFLDSYQRVIAISRFTQGWTLARWGRESTVLHPPVVPRPPLTKRPIILAVGRFFDPASGHGKHQLELVDAFRSLGEAGWTLHLVGGCEPEGERYLASVRAAADGLPVHLHPDASGAELRALYGSASLFWHATGLGEDRGRPERFEHFGITTVEAMSAGAVPLVFAGGGQLEVVEPGRSGRFWSTPAELVAATRELIADPARRTAMAGAARRAAERFAPAVFASGLTAIVDDVVRGAGPSGEVGGRPDAGSTGQTEDASRAGSRWGGDPWA